MSREKLPDLRPGLTKKIHLRYTTDGQVRSVKIYITTGEYSDGRLGEVFIKADKAGSTLSGMLDSLSMCMSMGLQYGVPAADMLTKLVGLRFEPSGTTDDPAFPRVTSITDVVARWLKAKYVREDAT